MPTPIHSSAKGAKPTSTAWVSMGLRLFAAVFLPHLCLGLLLFFPAELSAQPRARRAMIARPAMVAPINNPAAAGTATVTSDDSLGEERFPGGAPLKTDPEQKRLLAQAEKSVQEGRIDLAVILWQKMLDDAGDTLFSTDGRVYAPVSRSVEKMLARRGPEVLQVYRITADAEAASWMAKAVGPAEEEALSTIERRYFLSSQGDDAAFRLACLALDRFDFVTAQRLLQKIQTEHPDPSIPAAEIASRQAVVSSRLGDRKGAEQSLQTATQKARPRLDLDVAELIEQDIASYSNLSPSSLLTATNWQCILGAANRRATMPVLPTAVTQKTLSELWEYEYSLSGSAQTVASTGARGKRVMLNAAFNGPVMWAGNMPVFVFPGAGQQIRIEGPMGGGAEAAAVSMHSRREPLLAAWQQNKWQPTSQLLIDKGLVYFKSEDRLLCFENNSAATKPKWYSAWRNQFKPDSMSMQMAQIATNMGQMGAIGGSGNPRSIIEMQQFGDRIHQAMSIHGDKIYSIEGIKLVEVDSDDKRKNLNNQPAVNWGAVPRRARSNFLAAYDKISGKLRWHRGASDEDPINSTNVGFLAAPTGVDNRLLLPVTDSGNLWIYCLSADDGRTLWKRYLCDEPPGGCSPWSVVNIAIDGSEAYIAPGVGIVFCLDTQGGTIRQAIRYLRDGKPNNFLRNSGMANATLLDLTGWQDDWVIPYGRQLVVMASDCDKIFAIDRLRGDLAWETPRTSPQGISTDYCLGVAGRGLFVAGTNVVRRYDLPSGRLVWEKETEDSLGRGALTADTLYLPVKNSVLVLDLEKGAERSQVGVALDSSDPVGNLFSDGEKLWMAGAGRVYAMTSLDYRFEQLAERIKQQDPAAMLSRAKLRLKSNQLHKALDDLRLAHQAIQKASDLSQADAELLSVCQEMHLASQHPAPFLQLTNDWWLAADSQESSKSSPQGMRLREDLLCTALSKLATGDKALLQEVVTDDVGSAARLDEVLLRSAPLFYSPPLLRLATAVLRRQTSNASKEDKAERISFLKKQLESGTPTQRLLVAEIYATSVGKEAEPVLASLLTSKEPLIRLAAARGLATLKDSRSLNALGDLLASEDAYVRGRSYQTLRGLTGQTLPFFVEGANAQRQQEVAGWKKWLQENGKSVTWPMPLADGDVPLRRILLVSQSQGLARELDASHQERWRTKGRPTACQGLANGHRLIADSQDRMIVELDDNKNPVWKSPQLNEQVFSVQRLENGSTLATTSTGILEITAAGEMTQTPLEGMPLSAQRLPNGMTLVSLQNQGRIVELDQEGNIVWEVRGLSGPSHAVRLENGNTLVTQSVSNQITEYDRSGMRVVWKSEIPLVQPRSSARLPNGNTLICDQSGLHEVGPDGKNIVWQMKQVEVNAFSAF